MNSLVCYSLRKLMAMPMFDSQRKYSFFGEWYERQIVDVLSSVPTRRDCLRPRETLEAIEVKIHVVLLRFSSLDVPFQVPFRNYFFFFQNGCRLLPPLPLAKDRNMTRSATLHIPGYKIITLVMFITQVIAITWVINITQVMIYNLGYDL